MSAGQGTKTIGEMRADAAAARERAAKATEGPWQAFDKRKIRAVLDAEQAAVIARSGFDSSAHPRHAGANAAFIAAARTDVPRLAANVEALAERIEEQERESERVIEALNAAAVPETDVGYALDPHKRVTWLVEDRARWRALAGQLAGALQKAAPYLLAANQYTRNAPEVLATRNALAAFDAATQPPVDGRSVDEPTSTASDTSLKTASP